MKRQGYFKPSREIHYGGRWARSFALVLGLNLLVFALQQLFQLRYKAALGNDLAYYLGLNADRILHDRWIWQLLTHIFLHDFLPLVLNGILLWMIAGDLEARWGTAKVLSAYLLCGLGGGLAAFLLVRDARTFGSVGAVLGLLGIYGMLFPERHFFGMARARWFFWSVVAFHVFWFLVADRDRVAAVAQVCGGVSAGFLFLWSEPFFARTAHRWRRLRRLRAKRQMYRVRQRVDELLDRITREGFEKLTRRERAFLRAASKLYERELAARPESTQR